MTDREVIQKICQRIAELEEAIAHCRRYEEECCQAILSAPEGGERIANYFEGAGIKAAEKREDLERRRDMLLASPWLGVK